MSVARHYADIGIGWESLAAATLGGLVITLMTGSGDAGQHRRRRREEQAAG